MDIRPDPVYLTITSRGAQPRPEPFVLSITGYQQPLSELGLYDVCTLCEETISRQALGSFLVTFLPELEKFLAFTLNTEQVSGRSLVLGPVGGMIQERNTP